MTKFWCSGATDESCSGGTGPTQRDMLLSAPSSTDQYELHAGDAVFRTHWIYYRTVGVDGLDGDYDCSININFYLNANVRYQVAKYNSACTSSEASPNSSEFSSAGAHTATLNLPSATWIAGDQIGLRIAMETANIHKGGPAEITLRSNSFQWIIDPNGIPISSITLHSHHFTKNIRAG